MSVTNVTEVASPQISESDNSKNFPKITVIENSMQYDQMVCVQDIEVMSVCEHHFQPIDGFATLAYIPKDGETVKFFEDNTTTTAIQQANAFDAFINGDSYLKTRRGKFTERNGGRTPWNTTADLRITQDFNFKAGHKKNTVSFRMAMRC